MKTAGQYKYERDALARQVKGLSREVAKLEREVLDYQAAMRRMQRHNQLVLEVRRDVKPHSPQWHRILGWMDAMGCFTKEVLDATSQD